ncbi:hypothetical protein ABPG74_010194 [Tetrahymena malaccensis]
MRPQIIHILGGPGCGKGTQCVRLATKYHFKHLSAGDLLRQEQSREGSQYSKLISDIIKEGKIVPDFITCNLLVDSILNEQKTNKFLIDGYPRNEENLKGWLNATKEKELDIQALIFFECSKEIMWERIKKRAQNSNREDDNLNSFTKRLDTFYNHTMKVKDYFQSQNKCITINAEDTPENIFMTIEQRLKFLLK